MGESIVSPFPAPKTQELALLARKIQAKDNDYLREEIRKNPRFLALSTDVPTILQEGFRYNALHIAARYGNAEATQIILSTVNGSAFMKSLYPDDTPYIREQRTKYLTDMYLNAPDKGFLETPLHFACKFGCFEVIKILIGHPLCDLNLTNKDQKMAYDLICSRATVLHDKQRIEKLFMETKIVPVWRDLRNDSAPIVGLPVNPKYLAQYTPKPFCDIYGDVSLDLFGPVDMSCIPKGKLGHRDIRAYAGPMDEETAALFYSSMKGSSNMNYSCPTGNAFRKSFGRSEQGRFQPSTPPNALSRKPVNVTPVSLQHSATLASTPEQTQKSTDSCLTPANTTPKCPLTSNLLSPNQFQYTPQTLSLLLTSPPSGLNTPHALEDRRLRLKDPDKGLERVARRYATEMDVHWNEYWIFLGGFVDLSSESGLVLLEDHLCRLREDLFENGNQRLNLSLTSLNATPVTSICRAMQNLNLGSDVSRRVKPEFSQDWRTRLNHVKDIPSIAEKSDPLSDVMSNLSMYTDGAVCIAGQKNNLSDFMADQQKTNQFKVAIRELFPAEGEDEKENDFKSVQIQHNFKRRIHKESWSSGDESPHEWRTPPYLSSCSSAASSDVEDADYDSDSSPEKFLECETYSVYINGTLPSKEDYQAMHAVENVVEGLLETKFPEIIAWYNCLKASGVKK